MTRLLFRLFTPCFSNRQILRSLASSNYCTLKLSPSQIDEEVAKLLELKASIKDNNANSSAKVQLKVAKVHMLISFYILYQNACQFNNL